MKKFSLNGIFRRETVKFEKSLRGHDKGYIRCERCRRRISFREYSPLSLEKCPKCGDLIFIPMEIEDWWLTKPLAAGGFGSVYVGQLKSNPNTKAAVKVLKRSEDISQEHLDDLMREAEIAHSFGSHPHLMETYGFGCLEENAYMIMEYIEGIRLNDYVLAHHGRIHPEECCYYALDLISALEHIYGCGYIYRDMKPENVMIRNDNFAVIVDFGLCMTHGEARSISNVVVAGSPLYMAPERYLQIGEDQSSDIYSLGMVLFFTLVGNPFFTAAEIEEAVRKHAMKLRLPTQSKMSGFDTDIIELIDLMIRRNRMERIQSYDELRQGVFRILARLQRSKTDNPVIRKRRRHFIEIYGRDVTVHGSAFTVHG